MGVHQSTPVNEDEGQEVDNDPTEPARQVRYMLCELGLPTELVLEVMDLADYHPTVSIECEDLVRMPADAYKTEDHSSARVYFISPPLPAAGEGESWRMRKVTWYIEGRDQGVGGEEPGASCRRSGFSLRVPACHLTLIPRPVSDIDGAGTFNGAWSWYEACVFRPKPGSGRHSLETGKLQDDNFRSFMNIFYLYRTPADMVPVLEQHRVGWALVPAEDGKVVWHVQSNKVAEKEYGTYTVEWRESPAPVDVGDRVAANGQGDGRGFIQALRPGDKVGLLMCARYRGWENILRRASVELMYEIR